MANTNASGTNYSFPFQPQTSSTATPTTSGTWTFNPSLSGWASYNTAGLVFQTDQYNSKREGSGN
jgi:hypothetical protein